jgi:hypothetical protein
VPSAGHANESVRRPSDHQNISSQNRRTNFRHPRGTPSVFAYDIDDTDYDEDEQMYTKSKVEMMMEQVANKAAEKSINVYRTNVESGTSSAGGGHRTETVCTEWRHNKTCWRMNKVAALKKDNQPIPLDLPCWHKHPTDTSK